MRLSCASESALLRMQALALRLQALLDAGRRIVVLGALTCTCKMAKHGQQKHSGLARK